MIERIEYNKKIAAIIISAAFNEQGVHFFTPEDFSQQLAFMKHPAGKIIRPHIHNKVSRQVIFTQEVLILKKGKMRVDFYDEHKSYLESRILRAGDVILLAFGGHSFEVLEEVEMIEVKQGPYSPDEDKTSFDPVSPFNIITRGKAD